MPVRSAAAGHAPAWRSPGATVSSVPAEELFSPPPAVTTTSPATAHSCTLWSPSTSPSLRSITTTRQSAVENCTFG
jgi:hypothetical protein